MSYIVFAVVECFTNAYLLQLVAVDFGVSGLVRLRLFNGYMTDDVVLADFCAIMGFSKRLNSAFQSLENSPPRLVEVSLPL